MNPCRQSHARHARGFFLADEDSELFTTIVICCLYIGSPANRVTLQELTRRYNLTDKQLNSKIENSDTSILALYFDDVSIYSSAMGLAPAEQADMNRLYHSEGTQTAMMKCLRVWKQHDPLRATYRGLLDIVLILGKGDTADKICQLLKSVSNCKYMCISAPPPFPLPSRKQLSIAMIIYHDYFHFS